MNQLIDVIMLTKNSVEPCLTSTLSSLYQNVPVYRLIVVDGGSMDDTLKIVGNYPRVQIIDDAKGTRATSRQKGIQAVQTPLFMFLDSDVILCPNWYRQAIKYMRDDKVGAVWGIALPRGKADMDRYRAMGIVYGLDEVRLAVRAGKIRGLTHDTLIRTEAVKGIRIPSNLHTLEDHFIRLYIERKGYKWLSVSEPFCLHFAHGRERLRDWYEVGKASRILKFYTLRHILTRMFLSPFKSLWILFSTHNKQAAYIQAVIYFYIVKGWLEAGT